MYNRLLQLHSLLLVSLQNRCFDFVCNSIQFCSIALHLWIILKSRMLRDPKICCWEFVLNVCVLAHMSCFSFKSSMSFQVTEINARWDTMHSSCPVIAAASCWASTWEALLFSTCIRSLLWWDLKLHTNCVWSDSACFQQ